MQQSRSHLIFFLVVALMMVGYFWAKPYFFPDKKPDDKAQVDPKKDDKNGKKAEPKGDPASVKLPSGPRATPEDELLSLGDDKSSSKEFFLSVRLDPLGGGVRQIFLREFKAADDNGRPTNEMLELVPDKAQRHNTAFALYHYDLADPNSDRPLDTLGRVKWEVVENTKTEKLHTVSFRRVVMPPQSERDLETLRETARFKDFPLLSLTPFGTSAPLTAVLSAGQAVRSAGAIRKDEAQYQREHGVAITKTFSLKAGDYHVGLRVEIKRPDQATGKDPVKFRYQLAGARGLPVEGKWYTTVFRNAYIGEEKADGALYDRELQELRQISSWGGGNPVERAEGRFIRYAGVAVQYFASVIVVDNEQEGDQKQNFLKRARPSLETGVVRGKVQAVKGNRVIVSIGDGKSPDETVYLPRELRDEAPAEKQPVAIVYNTLNYDPQLKECPKLAVSVHAGAAAESVHPQWEDDITMRVNTEEIDLKPGDRVTHKYVLYHGPVKPSLLRYLGGEKEVDRAVIDRYADTLHLNSMTDYPSTGFFGTVGRYSGFSWLVIFCTNIIHRVLGWLTWTGIPYGLCILILTVLVRGMMFPLSRKQALMGIRMQALAPEVKALAEKYKDDQQARGAAVMELYKKKGVNPLGSCWVILLQMPVFMGLYYTLQESIQFRLAPFWPTWIVNLAAPDMMIYWGRSIPMISADSAYGGFIYLGPYLNLLPIVAVALMLVQQKMMTPPPADEQQEMQQKMMKWMMVIMCLMFYKVAAGLCIYFIASSLWGFAERKLLPKAKKTDPTPDAPAAAPASAPGSQQITSSPGKGQGKKAGRNRRKDREKEREKAKEEPATKLGQLRRSVSEWWTNVLDQAKKK